MSSALTIRNLTSRPVDLIKYEYNANAPSLSQGGMTNITHNVTSLFRNFTTPAAPPVAEPATTSVQQDVSIRIEPFASLQTDIKPQKPNETLHLTFETEGEKHRLDTPTLSSSSTTLNPLTENPRFNYTAVHLLEHSHLSLYSSAHLTSWMRSLKDDTPLSALSIPGTHNSPTCHRALPSVRCQATSPPEQLDNGVRFFDIRVQPESPLDPSKDGLILVHGVFPISLTGTKYLRDLLVEVYTFLDRNPSETVIMSLKREGTGEATDAQLSRILRDHYAGDPNRWFTAPRIPYLGEARGKIVLIRRFGLHEPLKQEWGGAGWGINAENWADNTPNATCPSGDICVQDFYEVLETVNIEKKIRYSQAHLERAARCVCTLPEHDGVSANQPPKQPFFINFLTASNFWKVGCWPEKIAAKLNPAIVDFLCRKHNEIDGAAPDQVSGDGSTGIVRTMLPPRSEKKRLVSRPLSPTHKRHKLAQYTQQTQASSRLNTLLLSPKQTLKDVSPHLQFSQFDDISKQRKAPHASALTHKLEIRSRPLRPEVDYKAVEARNTDSRPSLPHQSPVSDTPVHHDHVSNTLEENQPRADSFKAANASTKARLPRAQRTHWFWPSEMPAIRDHILRARKERAKAARTKPVKRARTPTSPWSFPPALTAQTVLPSPESSVSPSLSCAPSPLDLGSPDSIDEFPLNLRTVRVRTGERPMTDQDSPDHNLVTTSASSRARTVPKLSVRRGSFDRSSCPSPDPPPRYEESNHKGLPSSTKTTDPAPTTTSCNGSISESVSTCEVTNGNQEKCPTGFRNGLDQTKAKMTTPHLPRVLNRGYDRPHPTSLGAGRNAPILSCKVQVHSGNPFGACSAWDGCYYGNQHCTGAWNAKSKDPLLHYWNEAYGQFQAPEPLIVFTVTMNDATMPVISVDRDGEVNNAGAESSKQQRETSNPRSVPEKATAHRNRKLKFQRHRVTANPWSHFQISQRVFSDTVGAPPMQSPVPRVALVVDVQQQSPQMTEIVAVYHVSGDRVTGGTS
ncbi:MAG: hypothetical protein Q9210_005542 [Variospora velana]